MYYEEKLIDGVWQWRGTPDGEWLPMGVATLMRVFAEVHERERVYLACLHEFADQSNWHVIGPDDTDLEWTWEGDNPIDLASAALAAAQPASDGQEGK